MKSASRGESTGALGRAMLTCATWKLMSARSYCHAEDEMGRGGGVRHLGLLEVDAPEVGPVEEADAAAQEQRHDVQLQLARQALDEALLDDAGTACDLDVVVSGGLARLRDRTVRAVGDEVERRPALALQRLALAAGHDEHRAVVRRLRAPWLLAVVEHAAAHDDCAGPGEDRLDAGVVPVGASALEAGPGAPGSEVVDPLVQALAAGAERVVRAVAGAGDVSVEGNGDLGVDGRHDLES